MDLKKLNIEKIAAAVELDAGEALPGLRESLAEAKAGKFGATHTVEQIAARKAGRPTGTTKAGTKHSTTVRFDPDVLEALKATGAGWQTRLNQLLRREMLGERPQA